ncbi:hypothetical protein As57867_003669, partial [Aphanomyces stellatus]
VHQSMQARDRQRVLRRGWVRCLNSVDLASCPPMPNMVRAVLARSGIVCLETDTPGLLEVFYVFVPVHMGTAWNMATKFIGKRQVEKILRLEEYLAYQDLNVDRLTAVTQLPSRATAVRCAHCPQKFTWFRPKRQCHRCFDAVCAACGSDWSVDGKKLFVCFDCFRPRGDAAPDEAQVRPMAVSISQALLDAVTSPDLARDEESPGSVDRGWTRSALGLERGIFQLVSCDDGLSRVCDYLVKQ